MDETSHREQLSDDNLVEKVDSHSQAASPATSTSYINNPNVLQALTDKIKDLERRGTFTCHICRVS